MAKYYVLSTFDRYAHDPGRQLIAAAALDDHFLIKLAKNQLRQEHMTLVSYAYQSELIQPGQAIEDLKTFDLQVATHYLASQMQVFLMFPAGEEFSFLAHASRLGIRDEALEVMRVPI